MTVYETIDMGLKTDSAYDAWLRAELATSIADLRPSVSRHAVEHHFAAKRASLRRRLSTKNDKAA